MKKHIIWIIGGMWPEASCYLYKGILNHYQKKYNAIQDYEYPHLIINSLSLCGFSEKGIEDESIVKQWLLTWVRQIEKAWVDTILMACNTIHIYYDFLQSNSLGKIINLIEETVKQVEKTDVKNILILGSHTTRETRLYDIYLEKYNIWYTRVNDKEQKQIDAVIENIMKDSVSSEDKDFISQIVKKYNTDAVLVACTELPIIFEWLVVWKKFDTLSILTQIIDNIDHWRL